jgi:hypothetical protein
MRIQISLLNNEYEITFSALKYAKTMLVRQYNMVERHPMPQTVIAALSLSEPVSK